MSEETNHEEVKAQLNEAIQLLKKAVKPSTALDEFRHIDLSLISSQERPKYQKALMLSRKCINEGIITEQEFDQALGIK